MLKIENTEVLGWEHAIRGMRNPMNSWEKSDSNLYHTSVYFDECNERWETDGHRFMIGPNDLDLMTRLRNAGTDHRKFMRMIVVYADLTGPLYWWKEFDTYKVGTVANSCSTMHKIAAKEFSRDDFSWEHLSGDNCVPDHLPYSKLIMGPSLKDIPISNEIMEEAKRRVREELNAQWDKFYEMHSGHKNADRAVFRIRKEDVDAETWGALMKATQEGKSFHIFEEDKPSENCSDGACDIKW